MWAPGFLRALQAEARGRPSLLLFLAALAALPFKWGTPFGHAQAGWTDLLLAVAVAAWLLEGARTSRRIALRGVHVAYGGFLAAVAASGIAAGNHRVSAENVLVAFELVALALMTSDFASRPAGRRCIAAVIIAVVAAVVVEAAVGLALFYAGSGSSLTEGYSGYVRSSHLYTRLAAGFYSAPLLGSFCIGASAVLALPDNGLSARGRRCGQVLLAALALLTLSRAILGFAVAAAIRARTGHGRLRPLAGPVIAMAVAAAILLTVAPLTWDPVRPASSTENVNPRVRTIQTSARTFAQHPVLGLGPGTLTGQWQGHRLRAHLTPLNVAATTGLPSLVALAAAVLLLWRGRRRSPAGVVIWSGLAGLALDALVQDAEHFRHVWLMLGLADAERVTESPPTLRA